MRIVKIGVPQFRPSTPWNLEFQLGNEMSWRKSPSYLTWRNKARRSPDFRKKMRSTNVDRSQINPVVPDVQEDTTFQAPATEVQGTSDPSNPQAMTSKRFPGKPQLSSTRGDRFQGIDNSDNPQLQPAKGERFQGERRVSRGLLKVSRSYIYVYI